MTKTFRWSVIAVALVFGVSCGSTPTTPMAPDVVQVGGTWTGTITYTAVSGGEYLNLGFLDSVGLSSPFIQTISQSGASLTTTRGGCTLTGTAGPSSFALGATAAACGHDVAPGLPCLGSDGQPATRDLLGVSSSISGTVTGNQSTMTIIDVANVLAPGTNTVLGVLTVTLVAHVTR